jgi:drug/metabolite transporter (DMT)-like permease
MTKAPFSRPQAILILLALGVCFGANHIAARVAFDNGVGITTAILTRSGLTALVLLAVVAWQRVALPAVRPRLGWVLLVGSLVALQSLCLYSAVARVPVALALLVFNTMPVVYALLSWLLGGRRPSAKSLLCMGLILLGLALALDVLARLQTPTAAPLVGAAQAGVAQAGAPANFALGVSFAFAAAVLMGFALWLTENRLPSVPGVLRSLWTMSIVFVCMLVAGVGFESSALLPGGMAWPHNAAGWWALAALVLCYGTAFSLWFIWMPRLDMARNASAMNIEPVAVILLAWLLLGQTLNTVQIVGASVVVIGIVLLARLPKA